MSFHEKRMLHIKSACLFAYDQAREEHGDKFSSRREARATLRAEMEEMLSEIKDVKLGFGEVSGYINNVEALEQNLLLIQDSSINAMMELAQIWAVCEKMKKGEMVEKCGYELRIKPEEKPVTNHE